MNGWVQIIFLGLALAGIVWNAATLHNDVKHLKKDLAETKETNAKDHEEIKDELTELRAIHLGKTESSP